MYNKLFSKIVDSSIWLEPSTTRIVWVMFIAVMDEDGFVAIASPANVAHKARIEVPDAEEALRILESPDPNSANPDHKGRRIERVTGGWMVLNAGFYRNSVTRAIAKEQTRLRVAKFRAKKREETQGNAPVTHSNGSETPSEAVSRAEVPPNPLKGEAARKARPTGKSLDADWIRELKEDPTYAGINIDRELGKMSTWCNVNGKVPSRQRFVNWLNRAEEPLTTTGAKPWQSAAELKQAEIDEANRIYRLKKLRRQEGTA